LHSLLSLLMQRIDFNKLDTVALKRYRRIHKLDDVGSNPTKEELVSAVGKHFTAQVCWLALMGHPCILHFTVVRFEHFGCCGDCVKGKHTACRNNRQLFLLQNHKLAPVFLQCVRRLHIAVCCNSPCAQLTPVMAVTVALPSAGCG